jgi:Tol biopolymer transport system component
MNEQISSIGGDVMNSRKSIFFIVLLLSTILAFGLQSSPEHKLLFEKARFTMETKGDLKKAINLFKEIIEKYPEQRQYAAKSYFYIGLCYEKLGFSDAVNAYEQVLQKYADQTEQVAAARARLAAMREEKPVGLTVVKIHGPKDQVFEMLALSPDGTKIVGYDFEMKNIAVFDLVTKRFVILEQNESELGLGNFVWSQDGKKIAYRTYGPTKSLITLTLDGKAQLLYSGKGEFDVPKPQDWLPDGSAVIVTLFHRNSSISLGLVPAAGGSFKALLTLKMKSRLDQTRFIDASPDGRHIVYADGPERTKQNIYCISTDGQSLEVLSDHAANDIQPRWSPDGKHVVFLSDRHGGRALWGINVKNGKSEGEPFLIKEMMQEVRLLDWTAQGLAYTNPFDMWDVFVMPVDPETGKPASKPQQVDYAPSGRNDSPVWSPDGKYLAFVSRRADQPGVGYIVVLPTEGGEAREFLIPGNIDLNNWLTDLRWLPDSSGLGVSVGFVKPNLFRLSLPTGEWEKWTITFRGMKMGEWGPGGKSFIYAKNGQKPIETGIVEHNLETGQEHYIYRPEKGRGGYILWPMFSRNYNKLAFIEDKQRKQRIVVLDMETGKAETISLESFWPVGAYAWSADGQNLLVLLPLPDADHAMMEGKQTEVYIIPSGGGTTKKFVLKDQPRGLLFKPDWSPDGKKLAFAVRNLQINHYLMKNVIPENQR